MVNCLAYSTLAALIARTIIFPVGVLSDASYLSRLIVVLFCLFIFFISKRNFVYPTVISAIMMALISNYLNNGKYPWNNNKRTSKFKKNNRY